MKNLYQLVLRILFSKKYIGVFLITFCLVLIAKQDVFAQNTPCDCIVRWSGNASGTWDPNSPGGIDEASGGGIVGCGSGAGTQSNINASCVYDPTQFEIPAGALTNCIDPSPGQGAPLSSFHAPYVGQEVGWINFDVRAYAGTFEFQVVNNSNEIGWALFYSNNPTNYLHPSGLSGDCNDLTYDLCGVNFNGWADSPFLVPDISQPTNYYLMIWKLLGSNPTQNEIDNQSNFKFNFKARFGCGDSDIVLCSVESEDPVISCNPDGSILVEVPVNGINGNYIATDNAASNITPASLCLTNLGENNPVVSGSFFLTYPAGTSNYNITIAAEEMPANCAEPINFGDCTLSLFGSLPDCCVQSVSCDPNFNSAINQPACTTPPLAENNPDVVFDYTNCDAVVTMNHMDSEDNNICDGINITRTYTLYFDGVAQTPTCQQTISIPAPDPVDVSCPPPGFMISGCSTQDEIDDAFDLWLQGFSIDNSGCGITSSTDLSTFSAPDRCNLSAQSVTINYTATDGCTTDNCSATFTVTAVPQVEVSCPTTGNSISGCASQNDIDNAFAQWLNGFTIDNTGCGITSSTDLSQYSAPLRCQQSNSSVTVNFSATDGCTTDNCSATFTVTAVPQVVVSCPTTGNTVSGCLSQDDIDNAFALWISGFSVDNPGCGITLVTDLSQYSAPLRCQTSNTSVTITYSATDGCSGDDCTATFTVLGYDEVEVSCPTTGNSISGCASQNDIDNAFAQWLNGFTIDNPGCGITSSTDLSQYSAPLRCQTSNSSVTINFSATDGCSSDQCSATFTVYGTDEVEVSCPTTGNSISGCASQNDIDNAFAQWLNGFTIDNPGCGITSSTDLSQYSAPLRCQISNSSVTINFSATDGCSTDQCSATFTVTAAPQVEVSCPTTGNSISGCASQDDIDNAFAQWLNGFTIDNPGCGITSSTDLSQYSAPLRCQTSNSSVTINFSATDGCSTDQCSATFTVTAAPQVDVSCPTTGNSISGCASQDDINNAFAQWINGFTIDNPGCGITSSTNLSQYSAPLRCQTTNSSVTINFTATDGCSSDQCSATFTVYGTDEVEVSCPTTGNSISGCASQNDINNAFAQWLNGFTIDNPGCGITSSTDLSQYSAPLRCQTSNSSVTINFSATDGCSSDQCSATFTVYGTDEVEVSCPTAGNSISGCASQDAIDNAFAQWLNGFTIDNPGCGITSSTDLSQYSAPLRCQISNSSVTINFSATDGCSTDQCSATFTVTAAPQVEVSCPTTGNSISGCASQDDIDNAFAQWLNGFTIDNPGCGITSSTDLSQYSAPLRCQTTNSSVTINFTATDGCSTDQCSATFTVTAAPQVEVSCPTTGNSISGCASQDDIDNAFAQWLNGFTIDNPGCGITSSTDLSQYSVPLRCQTTNSSVTINFTATDGCSTDQCSATFTVYGTDEVEVSCPTTGNSISGCASQDAIDNAFAQWLNGFTIDNTGCGITSSTDLSQYSAPLRCQTSNSSVTINFSATDGCSTDNCSATFTVYGTDEVEVSCPTTGNSISGCASQDAIDNAFAQWLNGFTIDNTGCGITSSTDLSQYSAPLRCQTSNSSVTINFSATDGCSTDNCSATFTVYGTDEVEVSCPTTGNSISGCASQDAIDNAFAQWLNGFTIDNTGCGITSSTDLSQYSAPLRCQISNSSVTINFSATDGCSTDQCSATFTVTAAPQVEVSCPTTGNSISGCASQDDIDNAFAQWLNGFTIDNTGCGITSSTDLSQYSAPLRCQTTNSSVTINFTATDGCSSDQCSATFTVYGTDEVEVSCPTTGNSISGCASQDDIDNAFAQWLNGFTIDNPGCGIISSTDLSQYSAPLRCQTSNSSVTINFSATDGCSTDNCSATFTVVGTTLVDVECSNEPNTISGCATQDEIDAAFTKWLLGFSVVNDGCGITSMTDISQFDAPLRCPTSNTSVSVTFMASDGCSKDKCKGTFTVLATTPVEVACPTGENMISACASQDDINAAFNAWLSGFMVIEDGCGITSVTDLSQYSAPLRCQTQDASVTITYSATDGCSTDQCTATFIVLATTAVDVECSTEPNTISACATQDEIDAAFAQWLSGFNVVDPGCGITTVTDLGQYSAPDRCLQQDASVTITYSATDGCSSDECTATFTVLATTQVDVVCSTEPNTISACATQDEINAAFAQWLSGFYVADPGCGITSVTDLGQFTAPLRCQTQDATVTVTYSATDGCSSDVCTATFTVLATTAVEVVCPTGGNTISACATQDAIDAAFAQWLSGFNVVDSGCGITSVTDLSQFTAPLRCQTEDASVTVTYSATDGCSSDECTATFTVLATTAVEVACPTTGNTISACATQAEINTAFAIWLQGFSIVDAGCGIISSTDLSGLTAPDRCSTTDQTVTVTYSATDGCSSDVCTATFTVLATTAVEVACPTGGNIISACATQAEIDAAFAAWLQGFVVVDDGCGITSVTDLSGFSAPPRCITQSQTVTVTYNATDGCSSDQCTASFTVLATTEVEVSCPQGNNTISACASQDEINAAFANWLAGFTVDDDGCGIVFSTDLDQYSAPQGCSTEDVSVTINFFATDGCSADECTATFTVLATTAVEVSCPQGQSISACVSQEEIDAAFEAWLEGFEILDPGCGIVATTDLSQYQAPDRCVTSNTTVTVDFYATDGCSTDNCSASFTLYADTESPEIVCGFVDHLGCNPAVIPSAQDLIDQEVVTSTDNCSSEVVVAGESDIVVVGCEYYQTHTFKAVDQCGNESELCFITVSWTVDVIAPEISCYDPEPLGCNPDHIPDAEELINSGYVSATDFCGSEIEVVGLGDIVVSGCEYFQTHTFRAFDPCGNVSELCFVTVSWTVDENDPILTCPGTAVVECGDDTSPVNTGGWAIAEDFCSEGLVASYSDQVEPGDCDGEHIIYRTWSATDGCDNTGICIQKIHVVDNIPPVLTPVHPDLAGVENGSEILVECQNFDPNWEPFIYEEGDVIATDECSSVTVVMSEVLVEEGCTEDGVFLGFVSRWTNRWIATDDCGNTSEFYFTMKVVDNTPPVFTLTPENIVAACYESPAFGDVEVIDNCSNVELAYVDSQLPGDCVGESVITRTWTATDYCGNSSSYTQTIHLTDTEAPDIYFHEPEMEAFTNGQEIYVDCDDLDHYLFNAEAAYGIDKCDPNPEVDYEFLIFHSSDCDADGYFTRVETKWIVTDDCGNSSEFALTILAVDNSGPEFTFVPANVCTSEGSIPEVENATAIDNCSTVDITFEELPFEACDGGGVIERRWTATDDCGNSTTATQLIIVDDQIGPEVTVNHEAFDGVPNGGTVNLEANCDNDDLLTDLEPYIEYSDGCSIGILADVTYNLLHVGDCIADGYLAQYEIIIDVQDGCGNHTILQYVANLVDTEAPVFIDPVAELTIDCNDPLPDLIAVDNCSMVDVTVIQNDDFDVCSEVGTPLTRIWMATDACGNMSTFEQVIHIIDQTGPVLSGVPDDECGQPGPAADVTAFDECLGTNPAVVLTESMEDGPCGTTFTRTWTAVDDCGNETSASQQFFTEDNTPPQITLVHPDLENAISGSVLSFDCVSLDFDEYDVIATDDCSDDISIDLTIELLDSGNCDELGYYEQYRYTWVATDVCGNANSIELVIETKDIDPPSIHYVPDDVVLYCHEGALPEHNVMAFDNCSGVELEMHLVTNVMSSTETVITRVWKAVDACGNSTYESQEITLLDPEMTCSFPEAPESIYCLSAGNELTVEVDGGTGPYSYEWALIDCDGFFTGGEDTETVTYVSGLTPMTFQVTVKDVNGCETVCTITIDCTKKVEDHTFGNNLIIPEQGDENVPEQGSEGRITIAPNPASTVIFVRFDQFEKDRSAEILVTNIYGQVLERINLKEIPVGALEIDLQNYPDGLYSIVIRQENQTPSEHKFVKGQ